MRSPCLFFCGIACLAVLTLQSGEDQKDKSEERVLPEQYGDLPLLWIPKRRAPAELKGDLSAPEWQRGARVELVNCTNGMTPAHKTEAFLLCTDEALYIAFRCEDPKPDVLLTGGAAVWNNDEVEIFFEPDKDALKKPYHHLAIDASGKMHVNRVHYYPKLSNRSITDKTPWEPKIESRTGLGKDYWSCEIRIPFDQMRLPKVAQEKQTPWRLNLFRHRPERTGSEAMYSGWSPTGSNTFHAAGNFGYAIPETFASEELIEGVRKQAVGNPALARRLVEASVRYKIAKYIGELDAENYEDRSNAEKWLMSLAKGPLTDREELSAQLNHAIQASPSEYVVQAARTLVAQLERAKEGRLKPDPPPDDLPERVLPSTKD